MARKQLPALPESLTANDSDLLLKRDVNGQIDQKLTIRRLREEAFGDLAAEDNASGVPYSNTSSGLSAIDVQAAIDEHVSKSAKLDEPNTLTEQNDFSLMPTVEGDFIV